MLPPVHVVGYFPPPVTGQAIATAHLLRLIGAERETRALDLRGPTATVATRAQLRPATLRHWASVRERLRRDLSACPDSVVLWPAISPTLLGHWRDLTTVLPAFGRRRRTYAVVHRGDFHRLFRNPLTLPSAFCLVRRLAGIVFLDASLSDRCARFIPEHKRHVIANTIDDDLYCTPEEVEHKLRSRGERHDLRLLFVSNMIRSKGYLDLLDALAELRAGGMAVRADFVGHWPREADRSEFLDHCASAGLHDVVEHHGGIDDRAALKALYLRADLLVLPTYYPTEAQPLAIIEALNAGTPVIATAHAGIPGMIRDGCEGSLVPPRDPQALARAIRAWISPTAWHRGAISARQRFMSDYHPQVVRAAWLQLLS
jgi:glycosyltransferase involved in cell wall biosynthesis